MISVFDSKEGCCGCTACKNICPVKAIEMKPDEEGFSYPVIDQALCVDCGLCRSVCPLRIEAKVSHRFSEPLVYAAKHKEESVRMKSASGGAYTAISDSVLRSSGAVYGVRFDDRFQVQTHRATSPVERDEFRGSKYVQSDLGESFAHIQDELNNGKKVLFTGTGCQVAGLKKFLDSKRTLTDGLLMNDIICHGTTSPLLWNDYLDFIQRTSRLLSYTFRNKDEGWRGYSVKAEFQNGKTKVDTLDVRVYIELFASDLILRPSCYKCRFCSFTRPSDITIGDFWGIEKVMPKVYDNKGVSLVLINTPKGRSVLESIRDDLEIWESNTEQSRQPNLQHPTLRPKKRDQFWSDYNHYGFEYIAKQYGGYGVKSRSKRLLKRSLETTGILKYARKWLR